jgi:hypothetical protein
MKKKSKILIRIILVIVLLILILLIDKEIFAPKRVNGHNWKWNTGYSCGDFMFKEQYKLGHDTIYINNGKKAIVFYQLFDRLIITDSSKTKYGEYVKK